MDFINVLIMFREFFLDQACMEYENGADHYDEVGGNWTQLDHGYLDTCDDSLSMWDHRMRRCNELIDECGEVEVLMLINKGMSDADWVPTHIPRLMLTKDDRERDQWLEETAKAYVEYAQESVPELWDTYTAEIRLDNSCIAYYDSEQ